MEAEEREEESEGASYFRSGGGGLFLTELIILSEGAALETGGCDRPNGRRHPFTNHPSRAAASPPSTDCKTPSIWRRLATGITLASQQAASAVAVMMC